MNERMSETIGGLIQLKAKTFKSLQMNLSAFFFFLLYLWSMAKFLDFFLCQILTKCMKV